MRAKLISRIHSTLLAACIVCICGLTLSSAFAADMTVTSLDDSGPGTLRQALNDIRAGDTIDFAVTGTIVLTSLDLPILVDLNIRGPGADRLTIDGSGLHRIFYIGFEAATVNISGLTMRNGMVRPLQGGNQGAGIQNAAPFVTLTDCAIVDNNATGGPEDEVFGLNIAGGIYNSGGMRIERCLIAGNRVKNGYGGGIVNQGSLEIVNSTVANNRVENDELADPDAPSAGGGIFHFSFSTGKLIVRSCTIVGNRVTVTGAAAQPARGGGIFIMPGFEPEIRITTSVVALNEVTGDVGPDLHGAFESGGFNLIGKSNDSTGFTNGQNNDQVGGSGNSPLDPRLGALGDNGGPTQTMAPRPGSPAIDQGLSSLPTDQRGEARRLDFDGIPDAEGGDGSDVGAFELRPIRIKTIAKSESSVTVTLDAIPGYTSFQLQRSLSLASDTFGDIGSPQSGSAGNPVTFTDSTATESAAFYRVTGR